MGLSELWGKIKGAETFRPSRIIIPQANIEPQLRVAVPFQRNKQYFEVTVNQMYLTYSREWFKTWEPCVFVSTGFLYDGKIQDVPFFVGRKMLEGKIEKLPDGMIIENTKVAGLHPYRGGKFSVTVVLGRALKQNYLRKILNLIESTSQTYLGSFGTAVLPYAQVAKIVLDSYEDLVDSKDVEPLIGHGITFNPDTQEGFKPGYFALLNEAEENINAEAFFVKNGKLFHGTSSAEATPYRAEDYVLYSILAAENRSDVEILPYYQDFVKMQEFISGINGKLEDEQMKLLNARLFSLLNKVMMSPDLTRDQVQLQVGEFRKEINAMIDVRRPLSGDEQLAPDERDTWEKSMDKELLSVLMNVKK